MELFKNIIGTMKHNVAYLHGPNNSLALFLKIIIKYSFIINI